METSEVVIVKNIRLCDVSLSGVFVLSYVGYYSCSLFSCITSYGHPYKMNIYLLKDCVKRHFLGSWLYKREYIMYT